MIQHNPIPVCQECEAEPADFALPTGEEGGLVHICNECMRGIFERVMSEGQPPTTEVQ